MEKLDVNVRKTAYSSITFKKISRFSIERSVAFDLDLDVKLKIDISSE
jgi:hypothetical protein